jgi:hypothetical protein
MTATPRRRWTWAAVLFLLALATRWPLRGGVLEEYDSANYALAVLDFDLFHEQPHPPGYIFYVGATRLAFLATGDPIGALTAVSALSGAVSIGLLFMLLAPAFGTARSALAAAATLASEQVWLQQVRPLQDAFAFAWMLGAVLALVWATQRGESWRWCAAAAMVGLSAGAKQVLPIFLAGLILSAARAAWRRGGARWILAGIGVAALASLTWLVPLSLHCGSPWTYLDWAFGQVLWQREHDAALFEGSAIRLLQQARATFVTAIGPPVLALPLWIAALAGGFKIARRDTAWILWLVVPLILLRLLLLGLWPRFSLYYLPFVVVLAIVGLEPLVARVGPRRVPAVAAALLVLWCILHGVRVIPMLDALHRGPSPVEEALRSIAARRIPSETLLLTDAGVLARHVAYYGRRSGFHHAVEDDLEAGALRAVRHVVKLHSVGPAALSGSWTGPGEALGTWSLAVPRWSDASPTAAFWHVSAFELRGSYVTRRRFRIDAAGRWWATPSSAIVVFRAPTAGLTLRVDAAATGAVRFVVGGARAVEWDGRGSGYDVVVEPGEAASGRVRVDVIPACGAVADCVELRDVSVLPHR